MPTLFYFWMFACLANLGLPALSGFVAETAVYYGAFTSWVATVSPHAETTRTWIYISATGVLLTAAYMLWLLKRLFFGPIQDKWKGHLSDIRPSELALAYALTAMILLFGLYPYCLTRQYQIVSDRMSANLMSKTSISMNETQPVR
jgi:NADH-quinone oxidoreductase subunit M